MPLPMFRRPTLPEGIASASLPLLPLLFSTCSSPSSPVATLPPRPKQDSADWFLVSSGVLGGTAGGSADAPAASASSVWERGVFGDGGVLSSSFCASTYMTPSKVKVSM